MNKMALLTDKEVGDKYNISFHKLKRMRKQGVGIPYVKLNRRVRYTIKDIERYIDDNIKNMIDKKTFNKFDLLPFSASRINSWIEDKSSFVLHYLYKYDFAPSCAMVRGSAIEYGLSLFFKTKEINNPINCIAKAFQYYDEQVSFSLESDEEKIKQRDMIKPITELLFPKITQTNLSFTDYQMKIETNILGVPFIGYTDFTFENEEEITVIDVKTTTKFQMRDSHVLQQAIYKKALEEKYNKKVDVKLLYCTPKKCDFIEFDVDEPIHLQTVELNLKNCSNVLGKCKSPQDASLDLIPDLNDWRWKYASQDKLDARKKVWGV